MNQIIQKTTTLVMFLGEVLGPQCEIVLQDIEEQKIVAIANNGVSKRSIGSPLTDFALKMIANKEWKSRDYICNYIGVTGEGKELMSSTFFIKDEDKLIGMLCMNIDISRYKAACEAIMSLIGLPADSTAEKLAPKANPEPIEMLGTSIVDVTRRAIASLMPGQQLPPSRMTQNEKINIVRELNDSGIFQLKGAVSEVAMVLNCSEATVYRYLSKVNGNQFRV